MGDKSNVSYWHLIFEQQKSYFADVSEAFLNTQRSNKKNWGIDSETLYRFWLLKLL